MKGNLGKRFQMKDMGKLSWFLGIEFICEEGVIKMNQTKYIERLYCRNSVWKIANPDPLHVRLTHIR